QQIFTCIAEKVIHKTCHYRDFRIIHPDWKNRLSEIESTARRFHVPLRQIVKHSLSDFSGAVLLDRLLNLCNNNWLRVDLVDLLRSRLIAAPGEQVSAAINQMLAKDTTSGKPAANFWIRLFAEKALTELSSELQKLFDLDQSCSEECSGTDFTVWLNRCLDYVCDRIQIAEEVDHPGWSSLRRLIEQYSIWNKSRQSRRKHLSQFNSILRATNYQERQIQADAVELCSSTREDFVATKVLFYCGLTSRVPAKKRISAFDSEAAGSTYNKQFQLFTSQLVNAEREIYLFSPQYDDDGNEAARSPFLQSLAQHIPERITAKELPSWPVQLLNRKSHDLLLLDTTPQAGQISSPVATSYLNQCNQTWSVSRLERAMQCPYLHFAHDILKLDRQVDQVTEGATQALMGSLAHKALELWVKQQDSDQDFNLEKWIRKEANLSIGWIETHLELDRSLEELIIVLNGFTAKGPLEIITGFRPAEVEYRLRDAEGNVGLLMQSPTGSVLWKGQIDRIEEDTSNRLIIIDYKYKIAPSKVEFYDDLQAGLIPQLPIYSYLLQENQKKNCIGWLQIFLRSDDIYGFYFSENIEVSDKFTKDAKLQAADSQTKAEIHAKVFQIAEEQRELVTRGKIAPKPKDLDRCGPGNCDYADLCRYRQTWITTLK
ncbi:PD-(D/E)XK nuclease family protein, partial [bacterium]|nr:PD-(D/E)XK nuclease family protein [bacterium]